MRQKDPARSVEVLIQPNMAVHGDRRLIGDLFQNLIGNAWKFTSKTGQGRIEIGQSSGGSLATLYIRDNGAGFDMTYEQKLFKPFQRLHGAAEFDGSGVGLATVRHRRPPRRPIWPRATEQGASSTSRCRGRSPTT